MAIWTLAKKELRLLVRDPRATIILLGMPLIFILILGLALGALLGGAAWLMARAGGHQETYHEIVDAVVVRFVDVSIRVISDSAHSTSR